MVWPRSRASVNLGTVFSFGCSLYYVSSISPKPDNPVDCARMNWDHALLAMKLRRFAVMKPETANVKNDGYS